MEEEQKCKNCKNLINSDWFFCPYCGKKLREKPANTGVWSQLGLYLLSILLPPLNLGMAIRYIRDSQPKAKLIGWISVILMLTTLILVSWWTLDKVNKAKTEFDKQFGDYQYLLGY